MRIVKEGLMRLTALAALAAVGDMLAPEGGARRAVRFIGGLAAACVLLDIAEGLGRLAGWRP